ncbi:hypothetical protein SEA_GORGE_81 [Mycobacterium phage Gorge]|uniref:Uncharacterized protein n=1 Tax=Mycobacterium phage Gorge TaxID=2283295 RepID=A0A345MIK3_9CAUD|nr:hypothetical protein I5H44_gp081 [Mycobacterium phage Gorge]AXH70384.1 hypothetical protein SEA_GORGE_81 [Mycobacterium phage Gorge]QKO03097.1 hypothetical protein SEA_LASTJEDI_72 [Mycobacterium phage LastJedi]
MLRSPFPLGVGMERGMSDRFYVLDCDRCASYQGLIR